MNINLVANDDNVPPVQNELNTTAQEVVLQSRKVLRLMKRKFEDTIIVPDEEFVDSLTEMNRVSYI